MPLQRRRLLAALVAGAGSAADCIDLPGRSGRGGGTPTPRSAAEVGCPPYERREVERVVCSSDPPDDTLVFDPEPERAELPRAEIAYRLENDSGDTFEANFFEWTLNRYDGDDWWWLGPYAVPMPLHHLRPGETHLRRLLVDNTDLERIRPPSPEDRRRTRGRPTRPGTRHVRPRRHHRLGGTGDRIRGRVLPPRRSGVARRTRARPRDGT